MVFEPPQRSIWFCDRNLEGRRNKCTQGWCLKQCIKKEKQNKHWFLILSKKSTQGFVTVLPITSQSYQESLNAGEEIKKEDVVSFSKSSNSLPFSTDKTLALCNKPCRIPLDEFEIDKDYGRLKEKRYDDFLFFIKGCMMPN